MKDIKKLEKTCRFIEKILAQCVSTKRSPQQLEKNLLFISSLIDKSALKSPHLSFLHASLLLVLGQISNKKHHFLLAIKRLQDIENYFGQYDILWGKILLNLSHFSEEEKMIEDAIVMFEPHKSHFEVLWYLGVAYTLLGKRSFEVSDIKKAIVYFSNVNKCNFPLFWIDYAEALYLLGSFNHDQEPLHKALDILKKVIVDSIHSPFSPEHLLYGKDERGNGRLWVLYIKVFKRILELEEASPSKLDSHFYDAISSSPKERILWAEWSELYIRQGWLKKDFTLIEKGLSYISYNFGNITSEKEKDLHRLWFEPIIFAEALASLGLFAEELKLIKEAERVLYSALDILPANAEVWHALGILHLVFGLYFSDKKHLLKSIRNFKRGLDTFNRSFYLWHGLFEAYFSLAILENNKKYFQKALEINDYLLKLRPHSPLLHYEAALVLLQFGINDEDLLLAACEEFEATLALDNDSKYICRYAEALDRLGAITGHSMYFEKGIEMLIKLRESGDQSVSSQFILALLYGHLGQCEDDEENLYRAHYIFESLSKKRGEDDLFFCEWGNVLLHLFHLKGLTSRQGKKLSLQAEEQLMKALEYGNTDAHYHLACLYSLTEHYELSLEHLQMAYEKNVLPQFSELEQDLWLEGIRNTRAFQKFVEVNRDRKP